MEFIRVFILLALFQSFGLISASQSLLTADGSSIQAYPRLLGIRGESVDYVTVTYQRPVSKADEGDWVAVFSPSKFNSSICLDDYSVPNRNAPPDFCTAPIKHQYATFNQPDYVKTGKGQLTFRLINQRSDFSFALFSGLVNPVLVAVSAPVTFRDLKAPLYPRLAIGKEWNEMTVTWTSGYEPIDGVPFVSWGLAGHKLPTISTATTVSPSVHDMCGPPASTVGWRDPGHYHTGAMKDLLPRTRYSYRLGHRLPDNSIVLSPVKYFTSPPYPGEDSPQRVVIFGDLGKRERDRSNMYNNFQFGALNTTDMLAREKQEIDAIFHIGDLSYATGYISQWDQFTEQIESLSSTIPYMTASGNHERDWPDSGSFYNSTDSGGECGVLASTVFNMPVKNKDKFWYSLDYGLFRFCVADSEHDWREGTEQYKFIEECFASVDRQKQPWLIFIAHRVLGYSSFYKNYENTTAEPMSRENLQGLWQKYKVDLGFYGHVHNYERTCPVYDEVCASNEENVYSGKFNATIHIVAGNAGAFLTGFPKKFTMPWSLRKDLDYGYTKLTAFDRTKLLFEYKRSKDGSVYDKFWIHRNFKDVLGCDALNMFCPETTWARN